MYQPGDIAICTARSGVEFVAVYRLAPGIEYFWCPVIPNIQNDQLVDPLVEVQVIGYEKGR